MTETTAPHATWEREIRVSDHFTQIPHGLWTLPVSPGARCLLGWLHSHDPKYLASLTFNRIRNEFGASGQLAVWVKELVDAGFVRQMEVGKAHRFVLLAKPWNALATRQSSDYRTVTVRLPDGNRPDSGHIEEHVEDQLEEQTHMLTVPVSEKAAADGFAEFWGLYPRKVGKTKAQKVWQRLSRGDRGDALWALSRHVELWERRQVAVEFIPHPTSWLNARRWEDDLSGELDVKPVASQVQGRSAPGMDVIRRVMQGGGQ